jgi:hypothetical protein
MKKHSPAVLAVLYTTALFLAACTLDPPPAVPGAASGGNTGRVVISIAASGEAAASRTLLPEFGVLGYTVTITKTGDATPVFSQSITITSVAADLEPGNYTVSVEARDSANVLVAEGSGTVSVSLGEESFVTIRLASVDSGNGTFEYTVTIPAGLPLTSGVIEFFRLPSGTNPSSIDLSAGLAGTVSAGSVSLPAGFYRVVLKVETLQERKVAKTQVIHISDQTTTSAEFDIAIGDFIFIPLMPAGGSILYITTRDELAAIGDHIGSAAMNYGKNAYVLLNDIDLSGVWTPIGNETYPFQGYFFGENRRVTGLALSGGFEDTGLFGAAENALIQDLTLETAAAEINLEQAHYAGFVAGQAYESELINITVSPANLTVKMTSGYFGGAAGYVRDSRLRGISVAGASGSSLSFVTDAANILDWPPVIGGIAGYLDGGSEISESAVSLNINLSQANGGVNITLGGVAGKNEGTIGNSYAACEKLISVTTTASGTKTIYSGGVAGLVSSSSAKIENVYAAGSLQISVSGAASSIDQIYAGGISGGNSSGTVSSSAALARAITSAGPGSRILGNGTGTLSNNIAFNNMFVNGVTVADAVSNPQNDMDGLGRTAAQLTSRSAYESGLGWDFTSIWEMGPSAYPYPILKWQNGTAPALPQGFELIEDKPFAAGIGFGFEEAINLGATASTIYKNGSPGSLTLTAPAGYDAYRWIVAGKTAGTARNFSMNAADYAVGAHSVSAIVYRGTVPYSKNIVITVLGE